MKYDELKGVSLKKDLNLDRAIKRYHNKHKDNSGNFGFTLIKNDIRFKDRLCFDLDGDYNSEKDIYSLSLGLISSCPTKIISNMNSIIKEITLKEVVLEMNKIIEEDIDFKLSHNDIGVLK